jgi:general secretion pathway protein K
VKKRNNGFALIVVLWVVTLLTIMGSSFALTIQRESAIISGVKEKSRAAAFAEAGIHYAILKLLIKDKEQQWQANNSLYEIDFDGMRIRVQITDESGKIAINFVRKKQLLQMFGSIGVEEEIAESLSDAILDWRDRNDVKGENGAEKQEYKDEGLSYGPRNGPFESLEEVQMVLGMTTEIYKQLEDIISIYTKNSRINPKTAPRSVLLTLPEVDAEMVDEYLQQRVEQQKNSEPITAPEWYRGNGSQAKVFMMTAEAMMESNISTQVMAVVKTKPSADKEPFQILKWTKDYHQPSLFSSQSDEWVIN